MSRRRTLEKSEATDELGVAPVATIACARGKRSAFKPSTLTYHGANASPQARGAHESAGDGQGAHEAVLLLLLSTETSEEVSAKGL